MNIFCMESFWRLFSALVLLHDVISSIIYYIEYDIETLIRFGSKFSDDPWIFCACFCN
jgi:hypothetical protein